MIRLSIRWDKLIPKKDKMMKEKITSQGLTLQKKVTEKTLRVMITCSRRVDAKTWLSKIIIVIVKNQILKLKTLEETLVKLDLKKEHLKLTKRKKMIYNRWKTSGKNLWNGTEESLDKENRRDLLPQKMFKQLINKHLKTFLTNSKKRSMVNLRKKSLLNISTLAEMS
jgi:hypothetical protein